MHNYIRFYKKKKKCYESSKIRRLKLFISNIIRSDMETTRSFFLNNLNIIIYQKKKIIK